MKLKLTVLILLAGFGAIGSLAGDRAYAKIANIINKSPYSVSVWYDNDESNKYVLKKFESVSFVEGVWPMLRVPAGKKSFHIPWQSETVLCIEVDRADSNDSFPKKAWAQEQNDEIKLFDAKGSVRNVGPRRSWSVFCTINISKEGEISMDCSDLSAEQDRYMNS